MKKLKSTLPNIVLSLTLVCIIAGATLAATHNFTEKTIAVAMETELQNAIRNVVPEFDNNPAEDRYKAPVAGGDSLVIYPAKKSGQIVGYAIESYTKNGFSGLIRVMVGFDTDGKLYNFSVLEHNETPGLGSKMQEWFSTDKNKQSVIGRDMTKGALRVAKDGGDIDAITASTITSRAFLNAVNLAYAACTGNTDATSGATTQSTESNDATSGATTQSTGSSDAASGATTQSTENSDAASGATTQCTESNDATSGATTQSTENN